MSERPTTDEFYLGIVLEWKKKGTCPRRQTAALLVDKYGGQISAGYNGPPRGYPNCIEIPCPGVKDESGNTERCVAIHAEVNAIRQAGSRLSEGVTIYCTTQPCFRCSLEIANTNIKRVLFIDGYPDKQGMAIFDRLGIRYTQAKMIGDKK